VSCTEVCKLCNIGSCALLRCSNALGSNGILQWSQAREDILCGLQDLLELVEITNKYQLICSFVALFDLNVFDVPVITVKLLVWLLQLCTDVVSKSK